MGSDVSRVRFDALRDYSGVVLQQGRVLLDADWNELVSIIDRRLRANAVDLGSPGPQPGIAGVAVVPRTTPDAFRIGLAGDELTVGLGRMYVDGLVAEHHGEPADGFDPLLDDRVGTEPVAYEDQPYWPTPDPLPESGEHLVYLDVWEREITPLEAPELVEPAVGVDTTTRTQTVWQVRVLPNDGSAIDCTTPDAAMPGWEELTAPSGGRLSTGTVPVDDADDPCELPPTGGYRGPENQTYRVEVHDGGAPGTATFKWSRDNGSIASRVTEVVSPTRLRPASLGRDDVLRLRTGDWVEVTDDHRELDQRPGELRRIEVHEEDGTISFDDDLPAELQLDPDQAAARNLRVRRWDQADEVVTTDDDTLVDLDAPGADGTVPVPSDGAAVVLEHGITVTLTAADGEFRSGDHWIFVARTTDASVEQLDAAPPLGVHHHHARLAVVDFSDGGVEDCRVLWPPEPGEPGEPVDSCGECTVCVSPESHATGALTIQDAVDQVRVDGGTVCLSAGRYQLDEPVDCSGARSVRITGQGPRTLVTARAGAFVVERAMAVTIEDLTVLGGAAAPLVELRSTVGATLQRLALVNAAGLAGLVDTEDGDDELPPMAAASTEFNVTAGIDVKGLLAPAILLSRVAIRPQIRDNLLVAPAGIVGGTFVREQRLRNLLTAAMEVSANVMVTEVTGMTLAGAVGHLATNVVRDNTVLRGQLGGIGMTGAVAPGASVTISGNTLGVAGTGVAVGPAGCEVRGNTIDGPADPAGRTGAGVVVHASMLPDAAGTTSILDNHVSDVAGAGIEVLVPVDHLDVRGNHVARAAAGIRMTGRAEATDATVAHNTVRDVGAREGDEAPDGAVGIQLQGALRTAVESNTVDGVGTTPGAAAGATGIRVLGCTEPRIDGNTITRVGPDDNPPDAIGIHIGAVYGRARVTGNTVRRSDAEVDADGATRWTGLLVGAGPDVDGEVRARYVEATGEDRAFLLTGETALALEVASTHAIVTGNFANGSLRSPAAHITASGDLTITDNQLHQPVQAATPALLATADTASVHGNRATGGEPSIQLEVDPSRVAVVGNLVRTIIMVNGNNLAPTWEPLNPGGL